MEKDVTALISDRNFVQMLNAPLSMIMGEDINPSSCLSAVTTLTSSKGFKNPGKYLKVNKEKNDFEDDYLSLRIYWIFML